MPKAKPDAVTSQVKKLTARVDALEKRLERTLRQKPVLEKQLEKALNQAQVANVAFLGKLVRKAAKAVGGVVRGPIGQA
jgi:outer membrane murein-binding lipoprotein Lpp